MRRLLIVSPHFPPLNAPDMHRVRLALPHLRALGWEPVVLAVSPETIEGAVIEPLLEATYPADIRVVRVRGVPPHLTRPLGFGSLWWRSGFALRRAGDLLLKNERFDLVFFSTTQFDTFTLGPRWLRRYGIPYVLDFQDPWVNDHYRRTGERPPGGRLRFNVSQFSARRHEGPVVRAAAAIVSVSPAYAPDLLARHKELDPALLHHLPFETADGDFIVAGNRRPEPTLVDFDDGLIHIIYAGRCVPGMARSLRLLFGALRLHRALSPTHAGRLRFHFIGTDYAPPALARPHVLPNALEEGVADQVTEHPTRVPYFDALHYLARAHAILVLGSDDLSYTASKLYPCLHADRPVVCISHLRSPIHAAASVHLPETAIGFDDSVDDVAIMQRLQSTVLAQLDRLPLPHFSNTDRVTHSALGMTRRLTNIFEHALRPPD